MYCFWSYLNRIDHEDPETVTVDAMVAGHFIGPDALIAINLALPLTTIIAAISSLIGLGPGIMAALLYLFLPQVAAWLCSSEQLMPYLMEYLQVMPVTFCFILIVSTMVSLI